MNDKEHYLKEMVPTMIAELTRDHQPHFGIMTPQHMLEHLVWVTKSSVKDFGPPPEEPTDRQLGFKRFIANGAEFKHRPSDKKKEDLDPPRLKDLDEARMKIQEAIERFYNVDRNRSYFNPMMGNLSFSELETFHFSHFKYHLEEQFQLSPGA